MFGRDGKKKEREMTAASKIEINGGFELGALKAGWHTNYFDFDKSKII